MTPRPTIRILRRPRAGTTPTPCCRRVTPMPLMQTTPPRTAIRRIPTGTRATTAGQPPRSRPRMLMARRHLRPLWHGRPAASVRCWRPWRCAACQRWCGGDVGGDGCTSHPEPVPTANGGSPPGGRSRTARGTTACGGGRSKPTATSRDVSSTCWNPARRRERKPSNRSAVSPSRQQRRPSAARPNTPGTSRPSSSPQRRRCERPTPHRGIAVSSASCAPHPCSAHAGSPALMPRTRRFRGRRRD